MEVFPGKRERALLESEHLAEDCVLPQESVEVGIRQRRDEATIHGYAGHDECGQHPKLRPLIKGRICCGVTSAHGTMGSTDRIPHHGHLISRAEGHGVNGIEGAAEAAVRVTTKCAVRGDTHGHLRMGGLENGGCGAAQKHDALLVDAPHQRVAVEWGEGAHRPVMISDLSAV